MTLHPSRRRHPPVSAPLHLLLTLGLLLGAALFLSACSGNTKTDPVLRLSAQEALERGKELMEDGKYFRARELLVHAFEVEPNSVAGREALLLAADSYYLDGGRSNYIQAEARYRDFLNRFPTSDRAPYAQFQIANSLAQRMRRPDRDRTATEEALQAYQDLIRLYPTSEYAAQARDQIRLVEENLAEHEMLVGEFYLRYRLPPAAVERFEYLLENYPGYSEKDKALYKLGVAYLDSRRPEDAREAFDRLAREFPDSRWADDIPNVPEPQAAEPADEVADDPAGEAGEAGEERRAAEEGEEPPDQVEAGATGDGDGPSADGPGRRAR